MFYVGEPGPAYMHKISGRILHDLNTCTFDDETVVHNSLSVNIFIVEGFMFQSQ